MQNVPVWFAECLILSIYFVLLFKCLVSFFSVKKYEAIFLEARQLQMGSSVSQTGWSVSRAENKAVVRGSFLLPNKSFHLVNYCCHKTMKYVLEYVINIVILLFHNSQIMYIYVTRYVTTVTRHVHVYIKM